MAVTDTLVYPILDQLVSCLCATLADTPAGSPCYCGVVPGQQVAMDFCDCEGTSCGQAWVRLDGVYPSRTFPSPDLNARNCASPLGVRVEIGVTRCIAGMDASGQPPDEAANAGSVMTQLDDMAAMRIAAQCCEALPKVAQLALGAYRPIGPQGNCAGGAWTVTFQVMP